MFQINVGKRASMTMRNGNFKLTYVSYSKSEVQAIKEIEKWLKESELQQQESLITESTTLEANLSTDDIALDASLITEGAVMEACLFIEGVRLEACLVNEVDQGMKTEVLTMKAPVQGNDADADIGPSYDSDTMTEVPYSSNDTFQNVFAHGIQSHEQHESIPDTYEVNENNSNIISDIPNMNPDRNKEEHGDVDYEQQRAFFAFLINNLKCDVEKYAMICTMDFIGKYMLEIILHQQRTPHLLKQKKFMQTQEDHSNPIRALNVDSLKVDSIVIQNTCSETEDSNSETAYNKSVKESSMDSATKDVYAVKYKMSKAKERCMAYYRSLHSHLQVLSKQDLKGTRIKHGFKRAFMSLFGQDALYFHSQMTDKYFVEYTGIKVKHFRDTLLQHMEQESKIDTGKAVNDDLVVTESSGTESEVQDDNSRLGNDTDADDADIRPIYDEEPMVEDDQYPEQRQVKSPMLDSSPNNLKNDYSKQSIESKNSSLKETVAQFQKDFSRTEAHCIALELKYQNQALKSGQHGQIFNGTSNKAKIKKEIDVLETMNIELEHSVIKLRKENESLKKHYKDLFQTLFCSTCHKCVFNANHDACITKLLKEANSRAKIQSNKTRDRNKPVDQKSHTQIPGRQIFTGHRFSPNTTSVMYEKISPRSDFRWKPTGRIFKSVGLRWIPTGKLFNSCTSKVDSEPPHGSNVDISKIHECKQTLDLSAGTSINVQKEQSLDLNAELESLFDPLFDEYFNGENQVVSKPSAVTTTDTSDKRQQQPDSTSSTSTLATTVSADGNFDL
nr:hypothetical protein [Tanacetum cinerariifolium]